MISGSSAGQTAIWVNGCQTWARSSASSCSCRDESMRACLLECLERAVDLRLRVCSGEGEPQPARALGDGGRADGLHQQPALAKEAEARSARSGVPSTTGKIARPRLGGDARAGASPSTNRRMLRQRRGRSSGSCSRTIHRDDHRLAQCRRQRGGEDQRAGAIARAGPPPRGSWRRRRRSRRAPCRACPCGRRAARQLASHRPGRARRARRWRAPRPRAAPRPRRRTDSASSASGARSPSIEKTASVTTSFAPERATRQRPGEPIHVAVGVDDDLRPREPAAVDEATRGSARRRRRRLPGPPAPGPDAEVRRVAAVEEQRGLGALEGGESRLESPVRLGVSDDQARGARAHAPALEAGARTRAPRAGRRRARGSRSRRS